MGASPKWKVYGKDGEYLASCKYAIHAAAVVAACGPGATIRLGHSAKLIAFTEVDNSNPDSAGNSYDYAAQQCHNFELHHLLSIGMIRLRCQDCGWTGTTGFAFNRRGDPRCPSCDSGQDMIQIGRRIA